MTAAQQYDTKTTAYMMRRLLSDLDEGFQPPPPPPHGTSARLNALAMPMLVSFRCRRVALYEREQLGIGLASMNADCMIWLNWYLYASGYDLGTKALYNVLY